MKKKLLKSGVELFIGDDEEEVLRFSTDHWIQKANESIQQRGFFAVALSGGSTPKNIFLRLSSSQYSSKIDWKKVYLFWSDERAVGPESLESNYHMAMHEGKLSTLPIPKENIFRMEAEKEIEEAAKKYEDQIRKKLPNGIFDLIMLGMGEDGHTASLFPFTHALQEKTKWVAANWVDQKKCWRMTFTYPLLHRAKEVIFYVLGANKKEALAKVLTSPFDFERFPSQKMNEGETQNKAKVLWVIDQLASQNLKELLK